MMSPVQKPEPRSVVYNIQVLRAFAALLVVFVHMDFLYTSVGVPVFGHGGVDIFFVISGFIMAFTTQHQPTTPSRFILNRIIRVVPLYWLLTVVVFVLAQFMPHLFQSVETDFGEFIKSLLFVPYQKSNGLTQPVLFVGWTLNYEMFFYVIFAAGLLLKPTWRSLLATCAVMLALVILGALLKPQNVLAQFYTSSMLVEFVIGIGLALVYERIPMVSSRLVAVGTGLLVVAAFIALNFACDGHYGPAGSTVVCATLVVAGMLALERWQVRMTSTALQTLGAASYSLYLTHPFILKLCDKAVFRILGGYPQSVWICAVLIVVTFTAVILVGCLCHILLERPLTKMAKAWLEGKSARVSVYQQ